MHLQFTVSVFFGKIGQVDSGQAADYIVNSNTYGSSYK